MRRLSILLTAALALLAGTACNGGNSSGPTIAGETIEQAAIEACRQAQNAALAAAPDLRGALVAEGCAGLFSRAMCREAIRMSSQASPELRAPMIAVACQRDYCSDLTDPEPALCRARPAAMTAAELGQPWREFLEILLPRELAIDAESPLFTLLATSLMTLITPPVSASVPDAPSRPVRRLVVRIETDGSEYRIGARFGGECFGPWEQPLPPDQGDFAGLLEAAIRGAAGAEAVIEAGTDVPYAVVVELMSALSAGGIEEFSLTPIEDDQD